MKPLVWSWTNEREYRTWIRQVIKDSDSMNFEIPLGMAEPPLSVFGTSRLRDFWRSMPNRTARGKWLTSMRLAVARSARAAEWVDRQKGLFLDVFLVESDNYGFALKADVVLAWSGDGIALGIASEIMDSDAFADRFLLRFTLEEMEGPKCVE